MTDNRHPDDVKEAQALKEWTSWRCDWERALISYPFLSASDYAVGIEIARSADGRNRRAFPSQELIAVRVGRSVSAVEKSVKRLARLEFLSVDKMGAGGGRAFNLYTLEEARVGAALDYRDAVADLWKTAREEVGDLAARWQEFVKGLVHPPKADPDDLTGQKAIPPVRSYGSHPDDLTGNHLNTSPSDIITEKEDEDSHGWTPRREAS